MARYSDRPADNLARIRGLVQDIDVFRPDEETAALYGQLKADLFRHFGPKERAARRRFTLTQLDFDDNDLWIAATAIQHDLIIISADSDFPRIAEVHPLTVESWLAP